jgi:hypothetical protein
MHHESVYDCFRVEHDDGCFMVEQMVAVTVKDRAAELLSSVRIRQNSLYCIRCGGDNYIGRTVYKLTDEN